MHQVITMALIKPLAEMGLQSIQFTLPLAHVWKKIIFPSLFIK